MKAEMVMKVMEQLESEQSFKMMYNESEQRLVVEYETKENGF